MHDLDRKRSSFTGDDRATAQIRRDRLDGQGRRHHNDAQLGSYRLLQQPHHAQSKIALQAALVKLVEEDDRCRIEKGILVQESNEDARRHDQDARLSAALTIETHMIPDLVAEPSAAFVGHAPCGGTCRETSWFQEDNAPILRQTRIEQSRRHACRLARTRRSAQNNAGLLPKLSDKLRENRING
jgi:hypothetical protein